ncbi:signal peptide peptidase SppA [bacterium]|nr:signal peptide peptidase SppA [bacterium]
MRGIFRLVGLAFGVFVFLLIVTATFSFIRYAWFGSSTPASSDHVRVMDVSGVIMSSASFIRDLQEHLDNKHTKAIIVRINSPGGLVAPSQEIFQALEKADKKVPVLISMGTVAASGGYYIALGGRKIYANSGTLTGSIGVIMEFVNTQKLYQWAKMDRFAITSGKFKDAGSPLKPMTAEDKELFQAMVKDIYGQFRGAVKEKRKLGEEALNRYTDGRVLTGTQALEAKLVDALGTFEDVLAEARKLAKLSDDSKAVFPARDQGFLKKMLMGDEPDGDSESSWKGLLTQAAEVLPTALPGPSWRVLWLAPVH